MKRMVLVLLSIAVVAPVTFSQETYQYIFVPHVRSEDATNQTVNPGIAKIDFSKFSLKMLGGDLTPNTSESETTMHYLDSLFDLKNPSTLWSIGNHDIEGGSREVIKKYTGRGTYYSYYKDGITYVVLDCELDANSFSGTEIKSPQLDTLRAACENVNSDSTKFFVVLHSRYMWMVNNDYFTKSMRDSTAASSKSMTTSNWYTDVEPLLKTVSAKGIKVLVFGGDKSKINVTYSKDSITYYAARMENTFTDSINNVIVIDYVKNTSLTCRYVTLADINNESAIASMHETGIVPHPSSRFVSLDIQALQGSHEISVTLNGATTTDYRLELYGIDGVLLRSMKGYGNYKANIHTNHTGVYILKAVVEGAVMVRSFVVR